MEHPPMNIPVIPIGKIVMAVKEHMNDMEYIGLGESVTHPVEVYVIATKPDLENRYKDEFYFTIHEVQKIKKELILQHGKGAASVFKVKVELT